MKFATIFFLCIFSVLIKYGAYIVPVVVVYIVVRILKNGE